MQYNPDLMHLNLKMKCEMGDGGDGFLNMEK